MGKLEQAISISYENCVNVKITHIDISQAAINEQGNITSYIPVKYELTQLDHEDYCYHSYNPEDQELNDIDEYVQDFMKRMVHYKLENSTSVLNTV